MNFINGFVFFLISTVACFAWADGDKKFVLINGGSSSDSNYSVHETDLQAFNGLFGGNSIILNANGKDSLVVPVDANGTFQRDFWGWVNLRKTSLNTNLRATKSEVLGVFGNLSAQPPGELTVVYGDHGSQAGISLWGNDKLTAQEIKSAYSKFPDTVIRSIHLHCYGGTAVVDPQRQIPNNHSQMSAFLRQNYLQNKCALTLSAETELGQYYSWTDSPRESAWSKLFEKRKKPSLVSLKQEVAKDPSFTPSPLLTSDYLLKDVATAICKDSSRTTGLNALKDKCVPNSNFNEIFVITDILKKDLCTKCFSEDVTRLDTAYKQIELVYDDLIAVRQDFQMAFLKKKYPGRYKEFESAYNKIERELATSITTRNRPQSKSSVELERLTKEYTDKLMVDFLSIDYRDDFEEYFDTLDERWVNLNKEKFPHFARFYLAQPKEATFGKVMTDLWSKYKASKPLTLPDSVKGRSSRKIDEIIRTALADIQAARKAAEMNRQEACRGVAEPMLKNSKDVEIRKLYESINKCENSSIN